MKNLIIRQDLRIIIMKYMAIQHAFLLFVLSISRSLAQNCQAPYSSTFYINSSSYIDIVDSNMQFVQKSIVRSAHRVWTTSIPNAEWIWSNEIRSFTGTSELFFLIQLQINSLLSSATIQVAADNSASVSVNGSKVDLCKSSSYNVATSCKVKDYLKVGYNSFLFQAIDTGGDAGLIFSIALRI